MNFTYLHHFTEYIFFAPLHRSLLPPTSQADVLAAAERIQAERLGLDPLGRLQMGAPGVLLGRKLIFLFLYHSRSESVSTIVCRSIITELFEFQSCFLYSSSFYPANRWNQMSSFLPPHS